METAITIIVHRVDRIRRRFVDNEVTNRFFSVIRILYSNKNVTRIIRAITNHRCRAMKTAFAYDRVISARNIVVARRINVIIDFRAAVVDRLVQRNNVRAMQLHENAIPICVHRVERMIFTMKTITK